MKFALFEFEKGKSCEVGESRWIIQEDTNKFDNENWEPGKKAMVEWPCGITDLSRRIQKSSINPQNVETEMCVAKIIRFSGGYMLVILVECILFCLIQ